jgi:hypothetical protein
MMMHSFTTRRLSRLAKKLMILKKITIFRILLKKSIMVSNRHSRVNRKRRMIETGKSRRIQTKKQHYT